jgi:NAD(P)-dependent dehydrogenase (short-subunit alcohol dehydrogenase family)
MSATTSCRQAALVTGAARRIGRAIVEVLSKEGYAVAIHCHKSRGAAQNLAKRVIAEGGQAHVLVADLSVVTQVERLVPEAVAAVGPLTLLVNNASIFEDDGVFSLEADRFDRHTAVNLRAPLLLARDVAHQVPGGADASVVNIVDQRVLKPDPRCFSYALTKAALWDATRTMAQAFAPRLRVNAVAPGPTVPNSRDGEAGVAREAAATILGRRVSPNAIAEAVLFLARARHVTGQMLAVDSGQHLGWLTPDVAATMRARENLAARRISGATIKLRKRS